MQMSCNLFSAPSSTLKESSTACGACRAKAEAPGGRNLSGSERVGGVLSKSILIARRLQVLENKKWGIEGNWRVSLIFAILGESKRFNVNLPPETLEEIEKGSPSPSGPRQARRVRGWGRFANWPHFKTPWPLAAQVHFRFRSSQNSGKFTSYTFEQAVLF